MQTSFEKILTTEETIAPRSVRTWQQKLLPAMKGMVIILCVFFFIVTLVQLIYLHNSISDSPKIDMPKALSELSIDNKMSLRERQDVLRLKTVLLLETNTMERRHHQANVLLMSSIWIRYLGFVTGMILAFIGAIFILGKLREAQSEVGAKLPSAELTLKSASPGIIMVVLGTVLMIVTIAMQHTIRVNDASIYFNPGLAASTTTEGGVDSRINIPPELDSLK